MENERKRTLRGAQYPTEAEARMNPLKERYWHLQEIRRIASGRAQKIKAIKSQEESERRKPEMQIEEEGREGKDPRQRCFTPQQQRPQF